MAHQIKRLFITVNNKPSLSHPLMVVVEMTNETPGFTRSPQARWAEIYGVSVTDVNAGYSYANGLTAGLNYADSRAALPPIVIDPRLGLIDHFKETNTAGPV